MIPAGIWVASQLYAEFFGQSSFKESATYARTATERRKVAKNLKRRRGERLGSFCLIANVVMLALCALAFWQMYEAVKRDGMISTWDPYEILGVSVGDSNRQIKRAYRKRECRPRIERKVVADSAISAIVENILHTMQ